MFLFPERKRFFSLPERKTRSYLTVWKAQRQRFWHATKSSRFYELDWFLSPTKQTLIASEQRIRLIYWHRSIRFFFRVEGQTETVCFSLSRAEMKIETDLPFSRLFTRPSFASSVAHTKTERSSTRLKSTKILSSFLKLDKTDCLASSF